MSDVTTYKMDPEEQAKRKKRTPGFYVELKEQGYSDKKIADRMGVAPAYLSQMKGRWGFVGRPIHEMKKKVKQAEKNKSRNQKKTMKEDIKEDVQKAIEDKRVEEPPIKEPESKQPAVISKQSYDREIKKLEEKVQSEHGMRKHLERKILELESEVFQANHAVAAWREHHARAKKEATQWKNEHNNMLQNYEALNDQYQALEEESAPRHTITAMQQKIEELMNDKNFLEVERDDLRRRVDNLVKQLKAETERANYHGKREHHLYELVKLG
ncbi:hypothetical protein [Halobacillus karajensis]|uniref:hypothetical protein n=1 Tax=Halobacillus karajensis TaxID=195088 RepID=UPI00045D512A|nr:hypothetical protein [Halobacillus karajensis]CDQ17962.1 hypothetical protein BN982_00202 [Halobacillus karajensis]